MIVEIPKDARCSMPGCEAPATHIACGRIGHPEPAVYCREHAELVSDEDNPEYVADCPNCGCLFGVN